MGTEKDYIMQFTQQDLEIIMAGLNELPYKQVIVLVNKINDSYIKQCEAYKESAQEELEK